MTYDPIAAADFEALDVRFVWDIASPWMFAAIGVCVLMFTLWVVARGVK